MNKLFEYSQNEATNDQEEVDFNHQDHIKLDESFLTDKNMINEETKHYKIDLTEE